MCEPERTREAFGDTLNLVENCLANLDRFLQSQPEQALQFKKLTKKLYNTSLKTQNRQTVSSKALPKLLIDGFDEEQIWQQLELENVPALKNFKKKVNELDVEALASNITTSKAEENVSIPSAESESDRSEGYSFDDETGEDSDVSSELQVSNKSIRRTKPLILGKRTLESEVDDQFFKLSQLEEFLKVEDLKAEKGDQHLSDEESDDIDYFANIPSDNEGPEDEDMNNDDGDVLSSNKKSSRDVMYEDFFDPPEDEAMEDDDEEEKENSKVKGEKSNIKKVTKKDRMGYDTRDYDPAEDNKLEKPAQKVINPFDDEENDFSSENEESFRKTDFQKLQEKAQKRIKEMEENLTKPKPWQLTGEVAASHRPENSLMHQPTVFDVTAKQKIDSTVELTDRIEEIVKMAISNKAWSDVERKIKPTNEEIAYKRRVPVLDQSKSKKGLAEVYEEEYLKLKHKPSEEEQEDPRHIEIKKLMDSLLPELNALFSHIPKPPVPEIKVVNNLPAITVEEVAPVGLSDAALLAPEEIKKKSMGDVKSQTEKTDTDRKRERRKKKLQQKLRQKKNEEKIAKLAAINPNLAKKQEKLIAMKKLKQNKNTIIVKGDKSNKIKSSKDFFTRLEETVHNQIASKDVARKSMKSK